MRECVDMPVMRSPSPRTVARRLGISITTLREWTDSGVGPMTDARGRYDREEVASWKAEMNAQLAASSVRTERRRDGMSRQYE